MDYDQARREAESALRALSVSVSRAKTGDRRALDEGSQALSRTRTALAAMPGGGGDAWVFGKLNAETGRLAAELERTGLLMAQQQQPNRPSDPLNAVEEDARARIHRSNQVRGVDIPAVPTILLFSLFLFFGVSEPTTAATTSTRTLFFVVSL